MMQCTGIDSATFANLYTDSIVMAASNCGITAPTTAAVATSSPAIASSTEAVPSQAGCSSSTGDGSAEQQPELKRARTSVFASYEKRQLAKTVPTAPTTVKLLVEYLLFATGDDEHTRGWDEIRKFRYYDNMQPLFEYTFCSPATSAPVERAFSQGGLFMRPHRACLGDRTLCDVMYSKCNKSFK